MGEGNGFNRPGNVSTVSSDKEKAAINKTRGDKDTKMGSVCRVSNRDRRHQGGNYSPFVELQVCHEDSLQKSQKRTTERPQRNLCFNETEFQRKVGLPRKRA